MPFKVACSVIRAFLTALWPLSRRSLTFQYKCIHELRFGSQGLLFDMQKPALGHSIEALKECSLISLA